MNRQDEMEAAIAKALAQSGADETEILAFQSATALTRVANSEIHQNVAETNSVISVRAIFDNQIGTASTNRPEVDAIATAVKTAVDNAKVSPRVNDWPGLPEFPVITDDKRAAATRECTPGKRADLIHEALTLAKNNKLTMAGALETSETTVFIGNSHSGVSRSSLTDVDVNMVLMDFDSSGYAAWIGRDLNELDMTELGRRAAGKAAAGRRPQDLPPGAYTVILEPAAVADMLSFLAYVGLGALSVQEKQSFMAGHFGERLVDEKIAFWDDGTDPRTQGIPFDYEGVPKEKVVFFEKGVATRVVYDTRTAAREGGKSTGHALPAPNTHGPLPTNLFLEPGRLKLDEMIASTANGVLVTRFHYTNIEEPMRAVLTGMTRDGTFLIENGAVGAGLKNLRFTQSILDALSAVAAVGSELTLVNAFLGTCCCPALKIDNFHFTGISDT
ncbi:MAG: TldD/PmbA family protein [Actinomycetota bacterium]|nr:TldD/PmbA family protein [Actinomycetota bacterium]